MMWKKLKKSLLSLRVQIVTIVVVVWLVPAIVLSSYIATAIFPSVRKSTATALATSVKHASGLTLLEVDRLIGLAKDATYDGELTAAWSAYHSGETRYQEFFRLSRNYLERRYSRNSLISFAAFFPVDNPSQYMFMNSGYERAILFQGGAQNYVMELGKTLDTRCRFVCWDGLFCLVRNLYDSRLDRFGMLVLGVRADRLFEPVYRAAGEWDARVSLRMGEYASGEAMDWQTIPAGFSEAGEEMRFAVFDGDKDYQFQLVVAQNRAALFRQIDRFTLIFLCILLALVPVCLLVVLFVRKRVVKPLTILSEASRLMEEGKLGITVPMRGNDEIGRLGRAFSNMSTRIEHLVDRVYKEEIALRDAKIQAMQSRINPHFLNNALETINWQARMDGNEAISRMVDSLSVLLNAAMDRRDRRFVPIREELSIARAYCYFIRLRFGDRLRVEEDVDSGLLDRPIPCLLVQTLLENAVEHGIAPAGGGRIVLSVQKEGEGTRIEVINDGKRLAEEDLKRIRESLRASGQEPGFGLKNASSRLRLIYEGRAEIGVFVNGQGDTVAFMRIPPVAAREIG